MQELASTIASLAGVIEKGGMIGLLVGIIAWGVRDRMRMRKEMLATYRQRDYCRQVRARYKYALDSKEIKVDISDIEAELKDDDHMDKE